MDTTTPSAADLPGHYGQASEPGTVKKILLITGALLAVASAVFFFTAERQLDKEIEEQVGMSMAEFRNLPEEATSVLFSERANVLLKRRVAFGSTLAAGVVLVLIGLITTRRLRVAVVAALIILIISGAVFGVLAKRKMDVESGGPVEQTPTEMKIEKTIVYALLIATFLSLLYAGKLAGQYRQRSLQA